MNIDKIEFYKLNNMVTMSVHYSDGKFAGWCVDVRHVGRLYNAIINGVAYKNGLYAIYNSSTEEDLNRLGY